MNDTRRTSARFVSKQSVSIYREKTDSKENVSTNHPSTKINRAERKTNSIQLSMNRIEKNKMEDDNDCLKNASVEGVEELSEYELLRERNIEKRRKLFQELNINQAKTDAAIASGILFENDNKYVPSKRGLAAQPKPKEYLPPRKSLRLQRIEADTGLQLPEKEPTTYFMSDDVEEENYPLKDLELSEVVSKKDKNGEVEKVSKYLHDISNELNIKEEHQKESFSGDTIKHLQELKITTEQVAKVTSNRIFSLAVHPTKNKLLVAAGEKWGDIGIWDVYDQSSNNHGVHLFSHHIRPVNCLTFDEHSSKKLVSCSYDGTFRCLDLERQMSLLLYGMGDDVDGFLTYHCQKDASTFLVSGKLGRNKTATGIVGIVDVRMSNEKLAHTFSLFKPASAKTLSIHPIKNEMFACASQRGDCMLYDIRGRPGPNSLMKPIKQFSGHTKSISSAFFSPISGEKLATVAYDDKIRIYEVDAKKEQTGPAVAFYHNNQTGRWLSTFKAVWHPRREDILFVGSMKHPRQINVISDKGYHYPSLQGEHLGSICSLVTCHPTQDIVIGANSSGRVHVFM